MTAKEWKKQLTREIKIDHDYITAFDTTLNILCEILEERDRIYNAYLEDGARPTVIFTTDRGAENMKPNPLLRTWQELNTTALQYLRDLGLTAAGLRKLSGQIPKEHGQTTSNVLENLRRIAENRIVIEASEKPKGKTERGKK